MSEKGDEIRDVVGRTEVQVLAFMLVRMLVVMCGTRLASTCRFIHSSNGLLRAARTSL